MDYFLYKNGELYAENIALKEIAKTVGTPFYCYSQTTLERHFSVFKDAFSQTDALICFALKANSNLAVVKTLAQLGAGADVVSGGELKTALKAGIPPHKIVFSGVGKTKEEHELALKTGILQINLESEPELYALNQTALELGVKAPVAFRVNPDVDAKTHHKITTGKKENKFGIAWENVKDIYRKAEKLDGIKIVGFDIHIGSQLTELEPFSLAFAKLRELVKELKTEGLDIKHIDLGGGLGIPYHKHDGSSLPPEPLAYAEVVKKEMAELDCKIILEPGRMIAGNAGVLVSRVTYIKPCPSKVFAIIDAGMNDLMRPALYEAHHDMISVTEPQKSEAMQKFEVVGPICETGDTLGIDVNLPCTLKTGDLIAIETAGAYGSSMSNSYNSRPLIPEVMVKNDKFAIIRRRPTHEEMTALEQLANWQG